MNRIVDFFDVAQVPFVIFGNAMVRPSEAYSRPFHPPRCCEKEWPFAVDLPDRIHASDRTLVSFEMLLHFHLSAWKIAAFHPDFKSSTYSTDQT